MVEITGFKALRYAPSVAGPLATVVAPPYDVIGAAELRELWRRSPHNIVHLILPAGDLPAEEHARGYGLAAERLQAWKGARVLVADPRPALYLYQQRFAFPDGQLRTRKGFFALAGLTEWGGGIYRHELTLPGPVCDRIRLIEACQANLSSIFGLYSDPQQEVIATLEGAASAQPTAEVTDDHGVWHGLWRITDAAALARVAALLRERPVVVADGHHRYTAALEYRRRQQAARPQAARPAPWDYVLSYLGAIEDPGLVILPTHQALHSLDGVSPEQFLTQTSHGLSVCEIPSLVALREALLSPAHASHVALGAVLPGPRYYLIETPRPATSDSPDSLDVSVLRRRLVEPLLERHGAGADLEDHLRYTHDAEEAAGWVTGGQVDVAFILRPTPLEQVRSVALAGQVMPQKSTYFYPKVLSGLVIYDHTAMERLF